MITNVKKSLDQNILFEPTDIYCSNGTFSFRNETSPNEFVSRPIRAIALCIPTVHHFTRKMHTHIRELKISCAYFFSR